MVFVARCGIGFLHFSISVIKVFSLEGLLPTGCLFYLESLRGSVLGPLLFNLFVLDLPNFVQSNLPQYADDTLLYRPIYSEDDVTIMQKDLDNIISWCILNKMCLNADKCKVMRLSKKLACDGNTPSYKISNSSLSVVQNYKYLGVIISSISSGMTMLIMLPLEHLGFLVLLNALSVVMTLLFYLGFIKLCAAPLLSMELQHGCPINRVT